MPELIIVVVLLGVALFLAAFSANKLAANVAGALQGKGKSWAMTGRVATFTVSFVGFLFAILMVFGLFFGR